MEGLLVLLAVVLVAYFLIGPGVAIAVSLGASRRATFLEGRLRWIEHAVGELTTTARATGAAQPSPTPYRHAAQHVAQMSVAYPDPSSVVARPPRAVDVAAPVDVAPRAEAREPERAPAARAPEPSPAEAPAPDAVAVRPSLEEQVGLTWFTRLGAAVFLLGVLFFFKYAVDSEWVGPVGRVCAGAGVGAALIAAAEIIRRKTRAGFVHALLGIGLSLLFVTIWASAAFYELVSMPTAFAASTLVLLGGAALALRHRAQAILVLALAAGFLNPVVLSTGQDRALDFAYLLLVTTAVHLVAAKLRFRLVTALAVTGVLALFTVWYDRSFDVAGAYLAPATRVAPLAAIALFAAQWAGLGLWEARRGEASEARSPAAMGPILLALVAAPAGAALILPDSPRALAVTAVLLAALSVLLLRAIRGAEFLAVPLLVSFVGLCAVLAGAPAEGRGVLAALAAVWALVHVAAALRGIPSETAEPAHGAILGALAVSLFGVLSLVLFGEGSPEIFAATLAASAALVAWLAGRTGTRWILLATAAAGGLALLALAPSALAGAPTGAPAAVGFVVAAGAWAAVHFAALAFEARRRFMSAQSTAPDSTDAKSAIVEALPASLAGLAFVGVVLLATSSEVPALRSLVTGAVAIVFAAAGALLWVLASSRAPHQERAGATLLLGEALGLFAAAIAFGQSGATVTVVWAALAAVSATVAARTRQPLWLGISALLFVATLGHLVGVDAAGAQLSIDRFFATQGAEGVMALPALFNPRAYALAGTGLALLVSARQLSRGGETLKGPAALAAVLGYALLLCLAVTEARAAVTSLPPAPLMPGGAEWLDFLTLHRTTLAAQQGTIGMTTTLVLGGSAAALLVAGFAARDALHRYLGLALFLGTIAKLGGWDVWQLERAHQIVVLTGTGALLVASGFLYARFGPRIMALVNARTDERATG